MPTMQSVHVQKLSLAFFLVGNDQDSAKPITEVISSLTQIALAIGSPPEINVYTGTQHHSPVNSNSYHSSNLASIISESERDFRFTLVELLAEIL